MTTSQLPVTEFQECLWLVDYLNILMNQGKILNYTHFPASTYTKSWGVKMKNKQIGVKAGFPDYIILTKRGMICPEIKVLKGGYPSPEQKVWIEQLNAIGIKAKVCKGFLEAKQFVD